jgi:hypothetical protein
VMVFGFISKDINGDEIFYKIDWGDGNVTDWVGPCPSGEELQLSHVWNKEGGYWIRAKAKDSQGHESGWNNHRMVLVDDKKMNMVGCFSSTIFKGEDKTVSSKWYTNQFFYQKSFPFRCGLFENVTESDNSNILNFMK